MVRVPDRLDIDKTDRTLYDNDIIQNEIFEGKTRKEQFLFAMSIGFRNGVRSPLNVGDGFFLSKDMRSEDEALIDSLALFISESEDTLSDREEVFKIAEEYAHAGIKILFDDITSMQPGSYNKKLEVELASIIEDL